MCLYKRINLLVNQCEVTVQIRWPIAAITCKPFARAKYGCLEKKAILDVCKTRWIQRIDGLEVFLELFEAIVETMDEIKTNKDKSWNTDSTKKVVGCYHAIMNFQFIP